MVKNKNQEQLIKKIYEFYFSKRDECRKQYDMAENNKLNEIYEAINDENEIRQLYSQVSVVILTANKYEKNVFHANLYSEKAERIKRIPVKLFPQRELQKTTYAYYFTWHDYSVLHIEAQTTGSYTVGGSADVVRYVLENKFLYPTVVVSLGICFGIDEKRQVLGDTIISDKVYPYFVGSKWGEENYYVTDNNMFRLHDLLYSKIKSEIIDLNILNNLGFNVDFGSYITGEAVISNKKIRDLFANTTTQRLEGGEMEAYGLFKECYGRNTVIPCVVIKSICDWGVAKNLDNETLFKQAAGEERECDCDEIKSVKDCLQAYASYNAYIVLSKLMENKCFHPSFYNKLKWKIMQEVHEKVVYIDRIEKLLCEANDVYLTKFVISKECVENYCNLMLQEGVLIEINKQSTGKNRHKKDIAWEINMKDN